MVFIRRRYKNKYIVSMNKSKPFMMMASFFVKYEVKWENTSNKSGWILKEKKLERQKQWRDGRDVYLSSNLFIYKRYER